MLGLRELASAPSWVVARAGNKHLPSTVVNGVMQTSEGARNAFLTSYAGRLRRRGVSEAKLLGLLLKCNQKNCEPPLREEEVKAIVRSVQRYEPSSSELVTMSLNDAGNADRLVAAIHAKFRYVSGWQTFIEWRSYVDRVAVAWRRVDDAVVLQRAKKCFRGVANEADHQQDSAMYKAIRSHASRSLNHGRLRAACELAKADPRLQVNHRNLDADPMLLAVSNGVVDLTTGLWGEPRKTDFITRFSPVEYEHGAKCPTFKRFLLDVTGGDKDYCRYLVRLLGYLLTGSTKEQKFFFLYGTGANGKSTFLSVIRELLGHQLAVPLPADSLMRKAHGRSSTNDLARLEGARVVLSNEIEEGNQFDEPLLKALTGGDVISARFLYKEFVDFMPKCKLLIAGNHRPIIKGDDYGIWRRVELLPFTVQIPEEKRDPDLLVKLRAELPGILLLALRGCVTWQKKSLKVRPHIVAEAGKDYQRDMDMLGKWVEDCAVVDPECKWAAGEAYQSYQTWCRQNGYSDMTGNAFGRKLKARYDSGRSRNGRHYVGLGPK